MTGPVPWDGRDLTSVAAADVYKGDALAARLRRTDAGVEFGYLDAHLAAGGPAVATTLPLTDEPLTLPAGAVPPFFAGLLPEGRRLSSLRRAVKTSADDDLSLLLAVGADTVGDVRVVPQGSDPEPPSALVEVRRDFSEVRFSDVLDAAGVVDPVALAGVQDKVSARILSVPVSRAGKRYILKVDPPEYPHVVVNEAYFLGLARRARFPVVGARVVHDATERPGLLVERFDRVSGPDGSTTALAVEDAAQVLGIYPADKYAVSSERVAAALGDHCAARLLALREIYRQFCFAWLTGNGDLHAKNLSIVRVDGEWRVAPAYDLPSTLPYGDSTAALTIAGTKQGFSRRRLREFGAAIGLRETVVTTVLDEVLAATASVESDWRGGALPFGPDAVRTVTRSLRRRRADAVAG
jgi:serine/threonine-protein kinase HipA